MSCNLSLSDSYKVDPISELIFTYIIWDGLAPEERAIKQITSEDNVNTHKFRAKDLPISMDLEHYGTVRSTMSLDEFTTRYFIRGTNKTYQIDQTISMDTLITTNKTTLLDRVELSWTDTKTPEGFIREIGKSTIYFHDGEIVLQKQQRSAKAFSKTSVDKIKNTKFMTFDIETINPKGAGDLYPYLLCAFDGENYITSYAPVGDITQKDAQIELFDIFLVQLIESTPNKGKTYIYAHNLSGFDGILILKHLIRFGDVKPLIHNGKLMSITLKLGNKKTIVFKDSFLMLPSSLRKLYQSFNVSEVKGFFPFSLDDPFYKGDIPVIELWDGITQEEYNLIVSIVEGSEGGVWSFKDEAIKYCKLDCKALFEILTKFNELIFKEFQVNMTKKLTLPALAMEIYKTHFMPENSIYQILGQVEKDIRQSYTGGAVDVYIPHNKVDVFGRHDYKDHNNLYKELFYYDANSLYPTVMCKNDMPIGKPIYFEGDILKNRT